MTPPRSGPLQGLRVIELGGIGPGPHATMLLADLGADAVRIERPSGGLQVVAPENDWMRRSRRSIAADLKSPEGLALALQMIDRADVMIEGFRPGVTERLGIGPDVCLERNPRLVYGRMTGWGQDGPLAQLAGHDINYLSLTGVLNAIGPAEGRPTPPLNLVGDFGGGSTYLVMGILAALWERERSGAGQVVDAAIVDGVASLSQGLWSSLASGGWNNRRESNLLDGGSPFYGTYRCSDGRYVAVGAIEPQFYVLLLGGLGLGPEPSGPDPSDTDPPDTDPPDTDPPDTDPPDAGPSGRSWPEQWDRSSWPYMKEEMARIFETRTRHEWSEVFAGTDACVTPVLSFDEAAGHPHLSARATLASYHGVVQAAPAPRLSRTAAGAPTPPSGAGADTAQVLADWGIEAAPIPSED